MKVIQNPKTLERSLQLQLPLLSGFTYPVDYLSFVVVLPTATEISPRFTSTYRQSGIDSELTFDKGGRSVKGL